MATFAHSGTLMCAPVISLCMRQLAAEQGQLELSASASQQSQFAGAYAEYAPSILHANQ